MANRYFNKQVTESRKPLAHGGPIQFGKTGPKATKGSKGDFENQLSSAVDKIKTRQESTKNMRDKIQGLKNSTPELKGMEGFKKVSPKDLPERKKRQADYMKKHGERTPRRKTLSVTNSYKKEVEGLK